VTPLEASGLLRMLQANYPRTKLPEETVELWATALGKLDYSVGRQAVKTLIETARTWPSLAHLREQVSAIHAGVQRDQQEAERQERAAAEESLPRPPLREIPAAVELAERLGVRLPGDPDPDEGMWDW
jgi:hypothetical protein